jgi:uncharacterized protein DUF6519
MKADLTRDTFDPLKNYSRVLMQQGRVQIDADWNEQVAIFLHLIRSLAADVIGPYGGPGFAISHEAGEPPTTLRIHAGRYYVDGWMVENQDDEFRWSAVGPEPDEKAAQPPYVVYLHAWERHVTLLDDPGMREIALGGPDTTTRAQVYWQLGFLDELPGPNWEDAKGTWETWKDEQTRTSGLLMAKATESGGASTDPCLTSPEARYRGVENQLYRVEIHEPGAAAAGGAVGASFKWSRENGSVVFGIQSIDVQNQSAAEPGPTVVTLDSLGRDDRTGLRAGDRVELVDDVSVARNDADVLLLVEGISEGRVTLKGVPQHDFQDDPVLHTQLRRWDQRESEEHPLQDGAVRIEEGVWIDLEDGVQVQFESVGAVYRTGDYWLIPARTAMGDVDWPESAPGNPRALAPRGVEHHYAPLAYVNGGGVTDVRRSFDPLAGTP